MMEFRSIADLSSTILNGLDRLPRNIDIVAGIPRSGMLPATIIALYLNCQLTDLDGLIEGRAFATGQTRTDSIRAIHGVARPRVLVVDDSAWTGTSLKQAAARLKGLASHDVYFCAAYGSGGLSKDFLILEYVSEPRVFEWNLFHHDVLGRACVDIDGLLCRDPTTGQNDGDGPEYLEFLKSASPLHTPTRPIRWLVTNRLERYRRQTEDWLAAHQVRYSELVMLDLPDAETRQRLKKYASHKADFYRQSWAEIFLESDDVQAREIATLSGKPVIATASMVIHRPGLVSVARLKSEARQNLRAIVPGWLKTRARQALRL